MWSCVTLTRLIKIKTSFIINIYHTIQERFHPSLTRLSVIAVTMADVTQLSFPLFFSLLPLRPSYLSLKTLR